MAREKKVADASVLVKWFLNEEGSEAAIQLRNDHITGNILLIVPELAQLEVLNTLRYKNRDENTLTETLQQLWDIQLHQQCSTPTLLKRATHLALKHNLTIYDALYAALAELHGAELITADAALAKLPNATLLKK
jgi:predicted nucleic acid-binding protein